MLPKLITSPDIHLPCVSQRHRVIRPELNIDNLTRNEVLSAGFEDLRVNDRKEEFLLRRARVDLDS